MHTKPHRPACSAVRSGRALLIGRGCLVALFGGLLLCLFSGCLVKQTQAPNRDAVSISVEKRMGAGLGPVAPPGQIILPNGISLKDPLTVDEIILVAMWNNAAFLEALTELGMVHGDLVQAGLLPNPELWYSSPAHGKPYRWLVDFPIEAVWLRPIRLKGARREVERVADRLQQLGLDLIRDVRQAYADVLLAHLQIQVAKEAVRIRSEISNLASIRFKAGDISRQEAATAEIDAYLAAQDQARIGLNVSVAEERLRNLMGTGADRCPLTLLPAPLPPRPCLDIEQLTAEALATRPDLLAALRNVQGAEQRLKLAKLVWFRFLGVADASTGTLTDHEFSPTLRVTLPIFNWNQGAVARAKFELERAERTCQTIRNQIIFDVHQSNYRIMQIRAELDVLEGKVLPEVETNIDRAKRSYREGQSGYVVVLETSRQLIDTLFRQVFLHADLRRMWAELERSIGRRLVEAGPGIPAQDGVERLREKERKDGDKKNPEEVPEKKDGEEEGPDPEGTEVNQGERLPDRPGPQLGPKPGAYLPEPPALPRRDQQLERRGVLNWEGEALAEPSQAARQEPRPPN